MWRACSVLILFLLSTGALAQQVCPWLTQGTAATLMGGAVSANVHISTGEGTCEFVRTSDDDHPGAALASNLQMRIAVSHLPPKECATGERLTGIGQDSVFCATDVEGKHQEMIRGRVRGNYFLLTLTARGNSATDKATLRPTLEQAAEEVAGNLF